MVAHVAALLIVSGLAFFTGLGSAPLWEPDEPRFATATREMLRSHDYLNPTFNGHPRWEKPILVYWLQAASIRLGLGDEWAARMPAAVAGAATVLGVYFLAVLWWSPQAGLIAAAGLATTFRFVTYARQGLTDMPAVAGIVLVFLAFEYATDPSRPHRRSWAWYSGWVLVGLTALTKGPLALIAPLIWLSVMWFRCRGTIVRRDVVLGLLVAFFVGASWHVYMVAVHGRPFLDVNLGYEIVQRYLAFQGRSRSALYYWRILPAELAPWTLVVAVGLGVLPWMWTSLAARAQHGVVMATAWFVGVMLLCSFSHYKLPHYILPAYPAALLLMGAAIDAAWQSRASRRAVVIAMTVTAALFVIAGALAAFTTTSLPAVFQTGVMSLACILVVGGSAALGAVNRSAIQASLLAALTAGAGYATTATLILPPLSAEAYPFPVIGRSIARCAPPSVALSALGVHTSLVYYADRTVRFFETPAGVSQFLDSSVPRLTVLTTREYDAVKSIHPQPLIVITSHPQRSPRLSHLLDGRFFQGTDVVLVANPAAADLIPTGPSRRTESYCYK